MQLRCYQQRVHNRVWISLGFRHGFTFSNTRSLRKMRCTAFDLVHICPQLLSTASRMGLALTLCALSVLSTHVHMRYPQQ
jgi:hypothetical protein